MNMNENRKGISLIVLVITIIVIIILAGSVILNLSSNNPIAQASEATFRNDISTIKEQLNMYVTKQFTDSLGTYDSNLVTGKVSDFIPSITKYDNELEIIGGKISYIGTDPLKAKIARDMDIIQDITIVNNLQFNKPDLSFLPVATTKAVKWDTSNIESEIDLVTASADTSWYDYASKKWGNIKTSNNGNTAYWVWIPRYAYKIDNPHTTTAQQINIKFLLGKTNTPADGTNLPTDYIVHPAFTFGDKQLSGIWVAKYEASSNTPNVTDANGYTGGGNTTSLQVRVLPGVYSWRNIYTGNMQTVCMNMVSSQGSIGTTTNLDTHQMKNTEWGAVAYLSQSQYGTEPWINPYGDWTAGSYKLKTGYAGASKDSGSLAEGNASLNQYDTINGVKASTTGNIYGVYDMSGGANEYVAAYLDNGNAGLGSYGTSTYFTSNILKTEYTKYYNTYEPGNDEKAGGTYYGTGSSTLWAADNSVANNTIRKNLTDATYAKMANSKGDALYEISNGVSFYGKDGTNNYNWLINTTPTVGYATGWNSDYQLYGHASLPWLLRGGSFVNGSNAGVFYAYGYYGYTGVSYGFRPVLVGVVAL